MGRDSEIDLRRRDQVGIPNPLAEELLRIPRSVLSQSAQENNISPIYLEKTLETVRTQYQSRDPRSLNEKIKIDGEGKFVLGDAVVHPFDNIERVEAFLYSHQFAEIARAAISDPVAIKALELFSSGMNIPEVSRTMKISKKEVKTLIFVAKVVAASALLDEDFDPEL